MDGYFWRVNPCLIFWLSEGLSDWLVRNDILSFFLSFCLSRRFQRSGFHVRKGNTVLPIQYCIKVLVSTQHKLTFANASLYPTEDLIVCGALVTWLEFCAMWIRTRCAHLPYNSVHDTILTTSSAWLLPFRSVGDDRSVTPTEYSPFVSSLFFSFFLFFKKTLKPPLPRSKDLETLPRPPSQYHAPNPPLQIPHIPKDLKLHTRHIR